MSTLSGTLTSVLVSLLAWAVFLAFGSGRLTSAVSLLASPQSAESSKGPEVIPPSESVTLDAADILVQAQSVIDRAEWLATEMRHEFRCPKSWSSRGVLQRGPKGCCRLESSLSMGGRTSRMTVVSDGRILAQSVVGQGMSKGTPKVDSWPLPADVSARDAMLVTHNCGGPGPILAQARSRGSDWTAHLAVHADRPSIAVAGALSESPAKAGTLAAKNIRLFLDAETLTLTRAEWWTAPEGQGGTILLEIEFEKTRLNEPLTVEQCIEAFTLRAE